MLTTPRFLSIAVFAMGVGVLFGWGLEIDLLRSILPGLPSMKVNAAVGFCLTSAAVLLATLEPASGRVRVLGIALACSVAALGLATLAEYAFDWRPGIDQLFFTEPPGMSHTAAPGRMAIIAAAMFLILGIALALIFLKKKIEHAQYLAVLTIFISLVPIAGYMFGNPLFPKIRGTSGIATHAAFGFLFLSVALLSLSANAGFMPRLMNKKREYGLLASLLLLCLVGSAFLYAYMTSRSTAREIERANDLFRKSLELTALISEERHAASINDLPARIEARFRDLILHTENEALVEDFQNAMAAYASMMQASGTRGAAKAGLCRYDDAKYSSMLRQLSPENIEEHLLLKKKQADVELKHAMAYLPLSLMLFFGMYLLASILRELQREIIQRKLAEEELIAHRNNLSQLVEERTIELRHAMNEAQAASVAKTTFLANMSHEIRTPLNGISGMALLLERNGLNPSQKDKVGKIRNSSDRLLAMLSSVLDLSRLEANTFFLDENVVNLDDLIGQAIHRVGEAAKAKGLVIDHETGCVPPAVLGDAERLQMAVLNYLTNAIKFTESGRITVRARMVEESADAVLLRIEVSDTGKGMTPDVVARLFVPFEQGDNSSTRQFGGSGLGLAITRRVAELMGGKAGVETNPTQGSTFWLTARLKKC